MAAPVSEFEELIRGSRTVGDCSRLALRLQHTKGILDSERADLARLLDAQEEEIMRFLLPKETLPPPPA